MYLESTASPDWGRPGEESLALAERTWVLRQRDEEPESSGADSK